MSKYIVTDNNITYDSTYANIPYFKNEEERDNYVDTYLLSDWKNKLAERPELGSKVNTNISETIQIQDKFENIMNKNYIIIEKKNKYYFYFIESVQNVNNKTFILNIYKDLVMTYPSIFDKLQNFKLTQSHLNNYYGYQIDGGYKEVINVTDYPQVEINEVYEQLKNKGWLVVFERVNNENDYLPKIHNGNDYKEPYKIYIAPLTPFQVAEGETDEDILYEQSSPIGYFIGFTEENTNITIGLNKEFNTDFDINIYTNLKASRDSYNNKVFTINQELLPIEGNEKILLLPYSGSSERAKEINNIINSGQVYNDDILLNETANISTAGSGKIYYLPVKINRLSNISYNISFLQVNELLQYIPNAQYRIKESGPANTRYYNNLDPIIKEEYGIYIGSNINWQYELEVYKISQIRSGYWSSDSLFDYLEDSSNANIITAKTTNFIPIDTSQPSGVFSILKSNNIKEEDGKYRITSINYDNLLKINTYSLDVSNMSKYDLIEGLNKYALAIENQKEFTLNPNFISENNTIDFQHYASFTPNWEERFKYINGNYISLTSEENSFTNGKEFIKGVDELAQYKVNNPVTSKLEWAKPFFQAGNIATAILGNNKRTVVRKSPNYVKNLEKAFNKANLEEQLGTQNPNRIRSQSISKNLLQKKDVLSWTKSLGSLLPIIGGVGSVGVSRLNMKRQPDEFQGNGDINGDLIFNENGIKFSLLEYDFITPERDAIVEDIKRNGVPTSMYVTNLEQIKQPKFNYFIFDSLDNSNNKDLKKLLSLEEYNEFNSMCSEGFRLWYDFTDLDNLNYDAND